MNAEWTSKKNPNKFWGETNLPPSKGSNMFAIYGNCDVFVYYVTVDISVIKQYKM